VSQNQTAASTQQPAASSQQTADSGQRTGDSTQQIVTWKAATMSRRFSSEVLPSSRKYLAVKLVEFK
jgi:hypothetical protein